MISSAQLEKNTRFGIMRTAAYISKTKFFALETARAVLFPGQKIKILFSANQAVEKSIRFAFRFLHHEIEFAAFTPENIFKTDLVVPLNISDLREAIKSAHLVKNKLIPIP